MDTDDLEPITPKKEIKNLEVMSIEALHDYIGEMEVEIQRVRDQIALKEKARLGAESVFKS